MASAIRHLCLILILAVPATAQAIPQRSQSGPVQEKRVEIQGLIDEEIRSIALLEQQLNQAVDAEDQVEIERLRDLIQAAWDRVEQLRELKRSIEELESPPVRNDRRTWIPRRHMGNGHPQNALSTDRPHILAPRLGGANRDLGEYTEFSLPGDSEIDNDEHVKADPLESLRRWHAQLVADKEFDMAADVMELIRQEKRRRESIERELRSKRGSPKRPTRSGGSGSSETGSQAGSSRSSSGTTREDNGRRESDMPRRPEDRPEDRADEQPENDPQMQELIDSMKDELEALREEVERLRDKEKDDGN